jgi:hypothetical protein
MHIHAYLPRASLISSPKSVYAQYMYVCISIMYVYIYTHTPATCFPHQPHLLPKSVYAPIVCFGKASCCLTTIACLACVYTCMCLCVCLYTFIHMHINISSDRSVLQDCAAGKHRAAPQEWRVSPVCMYACMCVCIYIYTHTHTCVHICIHTCIFINISTDSVHTRARTHTHI